MKTKFDFRNVSPRSPRFDSLEWVLLVFDCIPMTVLFDDYDEIVIDCSDSLATRSLQGWAKKHPQRWQQFMNECQQTIEAIRHNNLRLPERIPSVDIRCLYEGRIPDCAYLTKPDETIGDYVRLTDQLAQVFIDTGQAVPSISDLNAKVTQD